MKKIFVSLAKFAGFIAVGLAALFLFREQLLIWRLGPPESFEVDANAQTPDYADLNYWAAHPDIVETSDLRLPGAKAPTQKSQYVDVFYVHPTTYFGPGHWNSNMKQTESAAQTLETMLGGHGTIFGDCCSFYAPRYREAHIAAFYPDLFKPAQQALDFAYTDVEAAFDYFLENFNEGRPFIIAGHSQGSLHVMRLLETRIDKTELSNRLVAAYPVGFWFSEDRLERGFSRLELCKDAAQIGCLVTYDTFGDGGMGRDPETPMPQWYASGWEQTAPKRTLCVNPISWRADATLAPRENHKGGMPLPLTISSIDVLLNRNSGRSYQGLVEPIPQVTSAVCREDGSLIINAEETLKYFSSGIDDSQMYHTYDWQLFYMDIKENVELRIAKYLQIQADRQPTQASE